MSLTAVSANDMNATGSPEIDDSLVSTNVDSLNETVLTENSPIGTFDELQDDINNATESSIINLTKDYKGTKGSLIHIDKNITIDGHGHTLDCLNTERNAIYSSSGDIVLKNLKITNCHNENNRGGAIYISGSARYTIENCSFTNNWAGDNGGAIYNSVMRPIKIINCQFDNNKADKYFGGAIFSIGETTLINSTFTSNKAKRGGAVYCEAKAHIENSTFKNNSAEEYGGAIFALYTYINVNQSSQSYTSFFYNNKVNTYDGGAIDGLFADLKNTLFKENYAYANGGAIWVRYCANIADCLFESNNAKCANGGALCVYSDDAETPSHIENSIFKSNTAKNSGGAVYAQDLNIDNSTFNKNNAGTAGGAIYAYKDININTEQPNDEAYSTFFIENTVTDCKTDSNIGGAISSSGTANIVNAYFYKNQAKVAGGALYCRNAVNVEHCLFENNKVTNATYQCQGGAIRCKGDVNIDNTTFKDNHADNYGGAVYTTSNVKATNALFDGNSANVEGGAIYAGNNVNAIHCLIENNMANGSATTPSNGGAILAKTDAKIGNCTFRKNYAGNNGGAISSSTLTLENDNFFDNNTAGNCGGAISANKFSKDVKHASFTNNNAKNNGGSIYVLDENKITFTQCVFYNNHCDNDGGAIYLKSKGAHLTLVNNIFISNTAGEGQTVCNCGYYDKINNNFWAGENPSEDNDQLIEKKVNQLQNTRHVDGDPLNMGMGFLYYHCNVNETLNGQVWFKTSNGRSFTDELWGLDAISLTSNNGGKIFNQKTFRNSASFTMMPEHEAIYDIISELYGYSISTKIYAVNAKIIAQEITAAQGTPATFNIHIEGNKSIVSNQKVEIICNTKLYTAFTDENGDARIIILNTNTPGNHDVIIYTLGQFTISHINITE